MKKILLFFCALLFSFSYAQDNTKAIIYLDQELEPIERIDFTEKSLSALFKEQTIETDSFIIKRLVKKYHFGQLNSTELNQAQLLIRRDIKTIDFTKNLLLVFKDSILGYTELMKSKKSKRMLDESDKETNEDYLKNRRKHDKSEKKCKKLIEKNNTISLHLYSKNENYTFNSKNYKQYKISKALESIFFAHQDYGNVILKPNGQYFFYKFITQEQVIKMLNNDWEEYIKDFNEAKTNPQIIEMGFIKEMNDERKILIDKIAKRKVEAKKNETDYYRKNKKTPLNSRIIISLPNCYSYVSY